MFGPPREEILFVNPDCIVVMPGHEMRSTAPRPKSAATITPGAWGNGGTTAVGGDPEISCGGDRGRRFQQNRKFDRVGLPSGQVGRKILLPTEMDAGGMRRV